MKLIKVQLYQKVEFESTVQGYFTKVRDVHGRKSELDMTFEDGLVVIKSDIDEIIIPVANVAIMKRDPSSTTKAKSKKDA